jgi:hypothetical protein
MPENLELKNTPQSSVQEGGRLPCHGSAELRFVLPPECSDGVHDSIVDTPEDVADAILDWCRNASGGDTFQLKTRMMTDEEIDALPSI